MPNRKPILVPVDMSLHSALALVWAARAARALKTSLVVLHVVHVPADDPAYYPQTKKKQVRLLEDAAAEMVLKFMRRVRKRHPKLKRWLGVEPLLVAGLPENRILEVCKKVDAQLIVVGSRGRTGLARAMLGSTAEAVARLAPVPVTLVKRRIPPPNEETLRKVVWDSP